MITPPPPTSPANLALPGEIAIVHCTESFVFPPGNRMRAARCLVCSEMIAHRPFAIVGAAALAGDPCSCGGIVSDVFLIHASHLPLSPAALQAALRRGLQCGTDHQ
jgi:hypothetical protein